MTPSVSRADPRIERATSVTVTSWFGASGYVFDADTCPATVDPAGKLKRMVTFAVAGWPLDSMSSSVAGGATPAPSAAREKRLTAPAPMPSVAATAGTPVPNEPARPLTVLVRRPEALIVPAGAFTRT